MANRQINLDIDAILDKRFNTEVKGYSPLEVDQFLDQVIRDYESYEILLEELRDQLEAKNKENETQKAKIIQLEGRIRTLEENETTVTPAVTSNLSQVDILRRIARLEQEIFTKK